MGSRWGWVVLMVTGCAAPKPSGSPTGDSGSATSATSATAETGAAESTGDTGPTPPAICETVSRDVDPAVAGPDLVTSLATWQALVAKNGADYVYVDVYAGYFSHYQVVTTVMGGVVVERCRFDNYYEEDTWVEVGAEVGSHGGNVLTVDEVYQRCTDEIATLNPIDYNYVRIDFRADGVLRDCVAFPLDCHDDCEFGYRVSRLEWL